MVRATSFASLAYGYETAFQTENSSKTKVFGLDQKINGLQFMVNRINLNQLYSPEVQGYAFGRNEGKMSVDFVLSNPWWLDSIFHPYTDISGNPSGSGPYTYTWTSANQNSIQFSDLKTYKGNSLSIDIGFQGEVSSGVNLTRTMLGAIVSQVSIKNTVNDTVKCTADLIWGKEKTIGTNSYPTSATTDNINFPYTFVHGSLQTNEGAVIAQIQDFDMTLNANSELLWGVGNANAVSAFRKTFEMPARFNCAWIDAQFWNDVINRAEVSNFTLTFDNGLGGTSSRKITFTGTGVGFNDHNTNMVPNDPVFQELNFQIRSMTVTAVNNSATPP